MAGRAGNSKALSFSIRFSICRFRGSCGLRHARSGQRHRSHRPGHGADDFRTGQKDGLEAYAPQDDEGRFTEGCPNTRARPSSKRIPIVIEILEKARRAGRRKRTSRKAIPIAGAAIIRSFSAPPNSGSSAWIRHRNNFRAQRPTLRSARARGNRKG